LGKTEKKAKVKVVLWMAGTTENGNSLEVRREKILTHRIKPAVFLLFQKGLTRYNKSYD
jgi:hypothetical protein